MTRIRPVFAAAAAASLALAGVLVAGSQASAGTRGSEPKQAVAVGTGGAVASADVYASRAGIEILRQGGNAVDAAVAVASTLGVTQPFVAGPGGGGFMVINLAAAHKVVTIDGREECPALCTPQLFLDPKTGQPLPFETARRSGLSVGVPGMVAQWAKAVSDYGNLSFAQDLAPAIQVAQRGFRVTPNFVQQEEASLPDLQSFTSSRQLFLTPSGEPLPVGSTFRNPDLAQTYRELAAHGPSYLYSGPLGADIVQAVQHPPVAPGVSEFPIRSGIMTRQDLTEYLAKTRPPTHVSYRGLDVYGMAPPSSGGTTVGEALNILSAFPLGSESRARVFFHYLEASRLAFADRNAYIGDPDYVLVPAGLLDPSFAQTRSCLIRSHALSYPVAPGDPYPPYGGCGSSAQRARSAHEGTNTNHLVTVDSAGNVVSYTNTIEEFAGSGITVPGRGFLLNNEMTDFDFAPPSPSTYDPNLPAPLKRPRSSMSPTIVLNNGQFDFAVGSPGGSTIITTVLQIMVEHIDLGLSLPDAIAAPRVSQRNTPTSLAESEFFHSALRRRLQHRFGEHFDVATGTVLPLDKWIGGATGVQALSAGRLQAVAEPVRRGGGSALVVNPTP